MSDQHHHAVRKLNHDVERHTIKYHVGEFLESRWLSIIILLLVFCDLVLVAIEFGIDQHHLCIGGTHVSGPPERLVEYAEATFGKAHTTHNKYNDMVRKQHREVLGDAKTEAPAAEPPVRRMRVSKDGERLRMPTYTVSQLQRRTSSVHHLAAGSLADHPPEHGEEGHHQHGAHHAGSVICEDRHGHNAHHISHTCHLWSVAILCAFAVEIVLKIWVNPREFFHNPFQILDAVIVFLSILVDTVVFNIISKYKGAKGGLTLREVELVSMLLIFLRFWRIVRIVHGAFETVHHEVHRHEKNAHEFEAQKAELEEEIQNLKKQLQKSQPQRS